MKLAFLFGLILIEAYGREWTIPMDIFYDDNYTYSEDDQETSIKNTNVDDFDDFNSKGYFALNIIF